MVESVVTSMKVLCNMAQEAAAACGFKFVPPITVTNRREGSCGLEGHPNKGLMPIDGSHRGLKRQGELT